MFLLLIMRLKSISLSVRVTSLKHIEKKNEVTTIKNVVMVSSIANNDKQELVICSIKNSYRIMIFRVLKTSNPLKKSKTKTKLFFFILCWIYKCCSCYSSASISHYILNFMKIELQCFPPYSTLRSLE